MLNRYGTLYISFKRVERRIRLYPTMRSEYLSFKMKRNLKYCMAAFDNLTEKVDSKFLRVDFML